MSKFVYDYDSILDDTAKKCLLTAETYSGDKRDMSISSGFLSTDLILGNAGWVPGWHTSLGQEQSAKTTTAISALHEALKLDIPIIQLWDYEKSFDRDYACNFSNNSGMTRETFGVQNAQGKWKVKPRIRSYKEHVAEKFFDSMVATLKRLPSKIKVGDQWYLIFDRTRENISMLSGKTDKALSASIGKLAVKVDNGLPQAVYLVDSYPAMLPEAMDTDDPNNSMAMQARMFSDNIKRVKGLIGSKNVIVIGINQLRLAPGVRYGSPEYEPVGEAMKLYSDVRLKHTSCAPPPQYINVGERDGENMIEDAYATPASPKEGQDVYRYIQIRTVKNKVGGSPRGTKIHQRVWVADEEGQGRGLDPVFDTWQYLKLTGQLSGNLKTFKIKLDGGNPINGKELTFHQLKGLIVGNTDVKKEVCKKLKVDKNPKIREACFAQLKSGKAYDLYNKADD